MTSMNKQYIKNTKIHDPLIKKCMDACGQQVVKNLEAAIKIAKEGGPPVPVKNSEGETIGYCGKLKDNQNIPEPWVSVKQAAKHLNVSKETIYNWIKQKKIPVYKIGRLWKFKISEIDKTL